MSYYVGNGGKIIVREEFRYMIENKLDFTGSTDPVFMLCSKMEPQYLFKGTVIWEKWIFDRESGYWEFRAVYNMRHYGDPLGTLMDFVLPYISQEIIEIYGYDEEYARNWPVLNSWKKDLQEQIEHRDRTIKEICEEIKRYIR